MPMPKIVIPPVSKNLKPYVIGLGVAALVIISMKVIKSFKK